jgi:hypothetical protein
VATCLPLPVDSLSAHIALDRKEFHAQTQARLAEEKKRLETLRQIKLAHVEERYGRRKDTFARNRRKEALRRIEKIFTAHRRWVEDSMTVAKTPFTQTPFIQIIGALVSNRALGPAPQGPLRHVSL